MAGRKTQTIKPSKAGQKPITFKKGGLRAATGTPAGQPIPAAKLQAAAAGKLGPQAQAQARFAINVLHVGKSPAGAAAKPAAGKPAMKSSARKGTTRGKSTTAGKAKSGKSGK